MTFYNISRRVMSRKAVDIFLKRINNKNETGVINAVIDTKAVPRGKVHRLCHWGICRAFFDPAINSF